MIRHKQLVRVGLFVVSAALAACVARPATPVSTQPAMPVVSATQPGSAEIASSATTQPTGAVETKAVKGPNAASGAELARSDAQGAVEFVVTPLNLDAAGATLDFEVSMNTHSVDLGWDLAVQSVLKTDTGLEVIGQSWPVGSGHYYDGTLSFPVTAAGGEALLEGAATLTLTIRDTDVPERIFTWELSQ